MEPTSPPPGPEGAAETEAVGSPVASGAWAPPDAPSGRRRRVGDRSARRRRIFFAVLAVISIIGCAGFLVHVPYTTISPGASVPLSGRVSIEGARTYEHRRGDVQLLFVSERNHVNVWEYLRARLDANTEIVSDSVATGGEPSADLAAEAYADMESAKLAATKVALERAGYRVPPSAGALVLAPLPSRRGAAALEAGDVMVAFGGRPVRTTGDLARAVSAHRVGESVETTVLRSGRRKVVRVRLSAGPEGAPVIGVRVFPSYRFPVTVKIDTSGIGGPSAGLAMTLAILDDLTPGDLTGGNRVAATGTIDVRGRVGPIGGIQQKGVSARAAGATIFLVPACPTASEVSPSARAACGRDLSELRRRAGRRVAVVPVTDLADALAALHERGGAVVVPIGAAAEATLA